MRLVRDYTYASIVWWNLETLDEGALHGLDYFYFLIRGVLITNFNYCAWHLGSPI